jgi:hypothetical protein
MTQRNNLSQYRMDCRGEATAKPTYRLRFGPTSREGDFHFRVPPVRIHEWAVRSIKLISSIGEYKTPHKYGK